MVGAATALLEPLVKRMKRYLLQSGDPRVAQLLAATASQLKISPPSRPKPP